MIFTGSWDWLDVMCLVLKLLSPGLLSVCRKSSQNEQDSLLRKLHQFFNSNKTGMEVHHLLSSFVLLTALFNSGETRQGKSYVLSIHKLLTSLHVRTDRIRGGSENPEKTGPQIPSRT